MSKLADIEAYFATSVNQARAPELQGVYEDWLIARVRKLETALNSAQRRLEKAIILSGSDPEYAAIAVEQYRIILKED